jgi:tetratricopeptide (TPR) repeat protein
MTRIDQFGLALGPVTPTSVEHFDAALRNALLFQGDPLGDLDRALAADRGLTMGYVLKALIAGLSTERPQVTAASSTLATARRSGADTSARAAGHLAAVEAWLRGEFAAACIAWEDLLTLHPNDAVAMYAAHQADFFLGQSSELRDRVARRLPSIERRSSLESHYLGMYAFGLEEMGDYDRALAVGARALEVERTDAWAIHAVAHVHEMTNQTDAGERWLHSRAADWSPSYLAVHLSWHRALYSADQQRWDRVLEIYDAAIFRPASGAVMELLDASSLLWRLELQDVDVGERWQRLAEAWEPRIEEAWYAFNDYHAMMAFAGARRFDLAERLLATLRATAGSVSDNGSVTAAVGLPVAQALLAYAQTRYGDAVRLLEPVRTRLLRAGGSHAQRDVIAQTLLAAADKGGDLARARALLHERLALRPNSPLNQGWMQRVAARVESTIRSQ